MFYSYPRSYYAGHCKFCGAPAYYNEEEDRIWFDKPEAGCLCYVEEEDENYSASRLRKYK